MIEINLLPGTGKKTRSRSAGASFSLSGVTAGIGSKVKDPMLIGALAMAIAATVSIGAMYWFQRAKTIQLEEAESRAQQDSARFAAVITQKRLAEAQRDSVLHQVELIKSFDNKRYVWPHLMDEISRALPPYTWVTSVVQTNAQTTTQANTPPPPAGDKGKKPAGPPPVDSTSIPKVQFRIVGNTVDIQALTRFMKLLEASPFIENVQLARSTIIIVDGKEVTEFQLDGTYQVPDPSAIKTIPVSLSVR